MDIHRRIEGATVDDIADAHRADLEAQWRFGVRFLGYWFSSHDSTLFCLLEAADAETARAVHRSSHGLVADEIFEVEGSISGYAINDSRDVSIGVRPGLADEATTGTA